MPAKSKVQQQAAGIALKAKREGKVDKLPNGAAKNMAKSMSEKELEKLAKTDQKGLPKDLPESPNKIWAGHSLQEIFAEEMKDTSTDDVKPEDQITTQKSKEERLGDQEISSGKEVQDTWASVAGGSNPSLASHSRNPMSSNTTGGRVSEQSTKKEKTVCSACGGTGLKDGHGNTDGMFQSPAMCPKCKGTGKIEKDIQAESINPNRWKKLAGIIVEQQKYYGDEYDWDEADSYQSGREGASAEAAWERTEQKKWDVLQAMKLHLKFHWENYQTSPDSWDTEDLIDDMMDMISNLDDITEEEIEEVAKEAIEAAQKEISTGQDPFKENNNPNSLDLLFEQELNVETVNNPLSETIDIVRWKKLAGLLSERLHPENIDAAKKYTEQLVGRGWSWDKIKDSLVNTYGYSLYDVDKVVHPYFQNLTKVSEAMEVGASNSAPNPGHKAKLNQA